jgi:hypothetical protein
MPRLSFALLLPLLVAAALACGDGGSVAADSAVEAGSETSRLTNEIEALEARVAAIEAVLRDATSAAAHDSELEDLTGDLALLRLRVAALEAASDPTLGLNALDPLSCARQYVEQQHIFMADYLTGAIPGCQP